MAPSKLERYLDVLEAIVDRPKKIDNIAFFTKMECQAVKDSLAFLISTGLVEERSLRNGNRIIYAITERGLSVFKTLRALKYLEKLKKTLPIVEEAREIASVLTKQPQKLKEQ